jgi:hypothetical protein
MVARAASIYGVDNIYIYPDPLVRDPNSRRIIVKILRYMSMAPYLRRKFFRLDRDLEYVGMLPPLRTPLHKEKLPLHKLSLPEYREGIVISSRRNKSIIDVGLDKDVVVNTKLQKGTNVIVKITKISANYMHGVIVEREDVPIYTGYRVVNVKTKLPTLLGEYEGELILTSRKGKPIYDMVDDIKNVSAERLAIVFGGPSYGLFEILEYYEASPYSFTNKVINFVPNQMVATIRMEEAVIISLSITSYILNL